MRFFFNKKPDPRVARLYEEAVRQARTPIFYQTYGVPDTLDGRFDMIVFHICPLIDRLRDPAGATTPEGQALFDAFVADMEQNLRTMGVGDLTVPKKMKKMGEAFYGRFDAYREAKGDRADLAKVAARNVLGDETLATNAPALALADYFRALYEAAAEPLAGVAFPDPTRFAPGEAARRDEALS